MSAATATRDRRASGGGRAQPRRPSVTPAPRQDRDRFAAYVAHELRTPIAHQRALVEVTLADPGADAAAWREAGKRVVASCVQQQRLIEALLDLVRSERGRTREEPVDLAAVTAESLRAHDSNGLERVLALEAASMTGDPDLVERLVANLISNAIGHNIAGGRLEVATWTESKRAVLSIANTGPPIAPDDVQRLFQPFQQLDSNCGRRGVGLGLAIVRAIADAHDAAVTARTRAGGGLEMVVAFPALN